MFFKLGQFYAKHRKEINGLAVFGLWVAGWLVLPEELYLYCLYLALTLIVGAYFFGRDMGRAEVRDRILGQTEKNGLAEVEEGTEVMGIKWMSPHWIYDNGKEVRRINYVKDHWEFEDGTRPERVYPGLKEIPGHWEFSDGTRVDPTQMDPVKFADALHDWAKKVSKLLPVATEGVKLGFALIEQDFIIQRYGAVLQQPGSMFRQESELPFPKDVIRRRLAEALLHRELDEKMRNALEVGYVELERFLPKEEFGLINPVFEILAAKTTVDYIERVKRGEDSSEEASLLAKKIVAAPDCRPVFEKVAKREKERLYQKWVFRSIAAGETDPDMLRLIEKTEKAVEQVNMQQADFPTSATSEKPGR